MTTSTGVKPTRNRDGYTEFLPDIQKRFENVASEYGCNLFTTNAEGLFQAFLDALPKRAQQHYTCHACRHFVEHYGGLVSISPDGIAVPALWDSTVMPKFFQPSIRAVEKIIAKAKVNGVFVTGETTWGHPVTGEWHHMHVIPKNGAVYRGSVQTASQKAAERKEEFKMLINGLLEFPVAAIEQAITLLKTDALYRSEKCLGVAGWLLALHESRGVTKDHRRKENKVWLAVASAPPGWCHIRSTMIGTLLEDIVSGMSFDTVSSRFASKMHPLQYQRPQAAPSAGNIAQAEKIIEQLGITKSLERRFARLDELNLIWEPTVIAMPVPVGGGVFSHLQPKGEDAIPEMKVPTVTMTWDKFYRTVLQEADSIEFMVSVSSDNYSAILTAVNIDAPPIVQWDNPEDRNPFSWYVYNGGSQPSRWGLVPGWCKVTGVCFQPSMWGSTDVERHGKSVMFVLNDAKDSQHIDASNGLFPEILKSELHGIRSTIEAYSKKAETFGYDESSACGIRLQGGNNNRWNATFRVTSGKTKLTYKLDRWD